VLVSSYIHLSVRFGAFWVVSSGVGEVCVGWCWVVHPQTRPCGPLLLCSSCMCRARNLYIWLCEGVCECMQVPAFFPALPPHLLVPPS
jgi:hypothetical protein